MKRRGGETVRTVLLTFYFSLATLLIAHGSLVPKEAQAALTVSEVAREFICSCGCNKVLTECDMDCGAELRGIIAARLKEGWGKDRIVQFMVQNYGERLLAAPTKKGFNLTAWIVPFLALFAGAGLVGLTIRRWAQGHSPSNSVFDTTQQQYLEQKHGARLEEELARFGKGK